MQARSTERTGRSVVRAAALAGALSGAPSTLHALARRRDPLAASRAAGTLLLPAEEATWRLVLAALATHGALSLGWTAVLARVLPARRTAAWGAVAGLAIAALDLGVVGRRLPPMRALPQAPQWADHLAFGALVGWALGRHRADRAPGAASVARCAPSGGGGP
jgi:hypothetical protein